MLCIKVSIFHVQNCQINKEMKEATSHAIREKHNMDFRIEKKNYNMRKLR